MENWLGVAYVRRVFLPCRRFRDLRYRQGRITGVSEGVFGLMSYALIVIGLALTIAGVRGTHNDLLALVRNDLSGQNSFLWWLVAVGGIGAIGYVPSLRGVSHAFLALILVVLILSNRGVFEQFTSAITQGTQLRGTVE